MPLPLYAPDGTHGRSQLPVLLYLYGGGFTIRSITTHDGLCRRLCSLAGCAVLSLDYRLAPENKFPTAQNDAWDVLYWLASHGSECGLDTARIAVGGTVLAARVSAWGMQGNAIVRWIANGYRHEQPDKLFIQDLLS